MAFVGVIVALMKIFLDHGRFRMKKFAKPLISLSIKEYVCIITVVNISILAEEQLCRCIYAII